MSDQLTMTERNDLQYHEGIIAKGVKTFIEVGQSLLAIKDAKLYRQSHDTFETYCRERWGFTHRNANLLIAESEVAVEMGTTVPEINRRQARELARIEPEKREAVVESAIQATDGKLTAKAIREAAVEMELAEPEPAKKREPQFRDAVAGDDIFADLESLIAQGLKFGTIYADPPWRYSNQATRASTGNHYAGDMSVEEICSMPVPQLCADKCHLHLWTTNAFLFDCMRIFEAWGFEFKSSFVWVKTQMGIGNYWRNSHEIMLLAVRGGQTAISKGEMSWLECPRGAHSAKPDLVRERIERLSPSPYLELFGRRPVAGWTVFGNQMEKELI